MVFIKYTVHENTLKYFERLLEFRNYHQKYY